jgi:ABC-type Fe3+/spermidine/putrescine transport system ATPase subunit
MLIKKFNGLSALSTVSFTVEDGDFIAPLRPISSGETTTLRANGGIESLDSGHVMCDGAAAVDLHDFTVTG